MGFVDRKAILDKNPKKRLIIGHDKLKQDYTEASALEYSHLYEDQSLSFILENSSLIFSEPYYGYDFYKNIVVGPNEFGIFHEYHNELEKVEEYLEKYGSKMSDDQRMMYESLRDAISDKISRYKNTILVAEYTMESHENNDIITTVIDSIYESSRSGISSDRFDELDTLVSEAMIDFNDDKRYFIYGPIIAKNSMAIGALNTFLEAASSLTVESVTDDVSDFSDFMEDVVIVSSMMNDPGYQDLMRGVPRPARVIFESFGNESPKRLLAELETEQLERVNTYYTSPKDAVNMVLDEITESALFEDDFNKIRLRNAELKSAAYDTLSNFLLFEYQNSDVDAVTTIDLFKEGTTVEDALMMTSSYLEEADMVQIEATSDGDENFDDEDLDRYLKDEPVTNYQRATPKKANAPKPHSIENRIQYKAMDAEAKQMKQMAGLRQKGQGIKSAVKAVTNLPNNVIKSIKQTIAQAEEKHDDKRKDYMKKPGYRKKIFRNLKLAILYGTTAQINLALLPVTALFRHFSKQKDRRLRNELVSELETEIKVCDEKINDASGAGDNAEKYKLMRIRAELERERVRVRTNSKYI